MPSYIEAKSVLDNQSRVWNGIIPFFVNTNDSRIEKRSSNGFLFDDPDSGRLLCHFSFLEQAGEAQSDAKQFHFQHDP